MNFENKNKFSDGLLGDSKKLPDYYQILGVANNASLDEIHQAYINLMKIIHPDKNNDDERAVEMSQNLNQVWRILSDPETRKKYNVALNEFKNLKNKQPQNQASAAQPSSSNQQAKAPFDDFDDYFAQVRQARQQNNNPNQAGNQNNNFNTPPAQPNNAQNVNQKVNQPNNQPNNNQNVNQQANNQGQKGPQVPNQPKAKFNNQVGGNPNNQASGNQNQNKQNLKNQPKNKKNKNEDWDKAPEFFSWLGLNKTANDSEILQALHKKEQEINDLENRGAGKEAIKQARANLVKTASTLLDDAAKQEYLDNFQEVKKDLTIKIEKTVEASPIVKDKKTELELVRKSKDSYALFEPVPLDYYRILGVQPNARVEKIKESYSRLLGAGPTATADEMEIAYKRSIADADAHISAGSNVVRWQRLKDNLEDLKEAYKNLSKDDKRNEYNKKLKYYHDNKTDEFGGRKQVSKDYRDLVIFGITDQPGIKKVKDLWVANNKDEFIVLDKKGSESKDKFANIEDKGDFIVGKTRFNTFKIISPESGEASSYFYDKLFNLGNHLIGLSGTERDDKKNLKYVIDKKDGHRLSQGYIKIEPLPGGQLRGQKNAFQWENIHLTP